MEVIGTELGALMCQICLPWREDGEIKFARLDEGEILIVAGSKPGGGLQRSSSS